MKFTFAPETRPLEGFTIKRAIHRGGFGEVYYALSDAGKEVALKLLNNNLAVELRGVRQCLNLKHPNLVTIFDIREDADHDHWVVMEYVSGRGLYETLRDYPNGMPINEVLGWLSGISAGLAFLHDRGIVHRDLKPANVFRDHGTVKIGDVGLSKYISDSRRSAQTQSVGTVYYMAPEVARGRYGREVDVYAIGIMLYEMLTGSVPFDGQTTAEILMKHLTAEPDLSVLPEPLRDLLAATLEKDPDKRISDIEEVERRFRVAIESQDPAKPIAAAAVKSATTSETAGTRRFASASPDADTVIDLPTFADQPHVPASGFGLIASWWNALPAPLQWVVGGAAALLILESGLLRPVAVGGMIGGVAYLGYQLLHVFVGIGTSEADSASGQSVTNHPPAPPPTRGRPVAVSTSIQNFPPDPKAQRAQVKRASKCCTPLTIRRLPTSQRATDITTSVSVSLFAAALVTLAVFLTTNLLKDATQAIYFGCITMLASWALILPCKLWEGRSGDSFTRRLTLGSLGLLIGYIAGMLPGYLLIDSEGLFLGTRNAAPAMIGRVPLSDGSGYPTLACFMLFFAALFSIRRWWWQVDSFRPARFRVSSALLTLLIGVVITGALQTFSFPDALGATWALAISAVVQLSSGWTPVEDRLAVYESSESFTNRTSRSQSFKVTGQNTIPARS
ncbi:MAG: serine/threonine protein kinase [Planctomycetaceae bacterium]|nr:serine/threonine protein kinase [Planctomycetaceae bacterium]